MIPAFYYPTTIVLLDDDIISLEYYNHLLNDKYSKVLYRNPDDLVSFFKTYSSPLSYLKLLNNTDEHDTDPSAVKCSFELDISKISELANSTDKYSEISILITDYYMPPYIDGIKLCSQFKDKSFKKILLTESSDYPMAIKALNERIIDYFANKSDNSGDIIKAIDTLVYNFFCDYTTSLFKTLNVDNCNPLFDEQFVTNLNQIIKSYNIKEFYLIDVNGSFLLKSDLGKSYVLINHDDNSINQLIEHLNEYNLYETHIESLKQRKNIPFWGINQQLSSKKLTEIDKYIYQANTLVGNKNYYWQLIEYHE